jgi:hypothetical protein
MMRPGQAAGMNTITTHINVNGKATRDIEVNGRVGLI